MLCVQKNCRRGFSTCGTAHTRCKKHSACYRKGLYSVDACDVCSDLRDCIREFALSNTEGAANAAWALRLWSNGVSRNCSGSNRPEDAQNFWYDQDEREELLRIFSTFCIQSRPESSPTPPPEAAVSVSYSEGSSISSRTPSPDPTLGGQEQPYKELFLLVSSFNSRLAAVEKGSADGTAGTANSRPPSPTPGTSGTSIDSVTPVKPTDQDIASRTSTGAKAGSKTVSSLRDWRPVDDDMQFDEASGTIQFDGDKTYGPKSIELDCTGRWPRYRFISRLKGLGPTRVSKALLSPKQAFEDYASFLLPNCPSAAQSHLSIHPQGRGIRLSDETQIFLKPFFKNAVDQFQIYVSSKKIDWEESLLPFSVVPAPLKDKSFPEDFEKVFSTKKISPLCAAEQLSLEIPKLSDELLAKDLFARNHLSDLLSILQSSEGLAMSDSSEAGKKAHMGLAKLALRPLMSALALFFEARLALRKKALEKFDSVNPHVLSLIKCNPFSADIFAASTVESLLTQSQNQSKSLSVLLQQKSSLKRSFHGKNKSGPIRKFQRPENGNRRPPYQSPLQVPSRFNRKSSETSRDYTPKEQGNGSRQPFRGHQNQGDRSARPPRGGRGGQRDRQKRQ